MKYKTILADPPWNIGEMRMKKARLYGSSKGGSK